MYEMDLPCSPSDSQIGSLIVKVSAFQTGGMGFNFMSDYKAGHDGYSKYSWMGKYEPSCL